MSSPLAAVFVRRSGAGGHGHVGWAFELRSGLSCCGAIENYKSSPVSNPQHKGMWFRIVPNNRVLNLFHAMDYDEYKEFHLRAAQSNVAMSAVRYWDTQPYEVFGKNCMDAVYDVMRCYGAKLPGPKQMENWRPNDWYDHIPVASQVVVPTMSGIDLFAERPEFELLDELIESFDVRCPVWRNPENLKLIAGD